MAWEMSCQLLSALVLLSGAEGSTRALIWVAAPRRACPWDIQKEIPTPIHKPARIDALKLAFQYLFLCLLGSLVKEHGMFWVAVLSGMPLLMHGCIFSVLPAFRVHLNSISEEVSTTSSLGWSTCLSSNKQAPVSLAYYTAADAFLTAYQCALCTEYIDAHNSIRKHN